MEKVETTLTIGAAAKAVFDYLNDPGHLIQMIPGATHVDNIVHLSHGGWIFRWTRLLDGVRFEGCGECVAHKPYEHIRYVLTGGLHNELDWRLSPAEESGTNVTVSLTYSLPIPLKHRHEPAVIGAEYQADIERHLGRLALFFETPEKITG